MFRTFSDFTRIYLVRIFERAVVSRFCLAGTLDYLFVSNVIYIALFSEKCYGQVVAIFELHSSVNIGFV